MTATPNSMIEGELGQDALAVAQDALPYDHDVGRGGHRPQDFSARTYLTTKEAAEYLRRSASWLTRQPDIPYVRGIPNVYKRSDLDDWFERHKFVPDVA